MGIIELIQVTKKYGDKIVLKDFNFEVKEGEFWSVVGSSGSGKTTLLNLIGLLDVPDNGEVRIKGKMNLKKDSREWRRLLREDISFLFQNYGLIEGETVEYNLKLVMRYKDILKKEEKDIMMKALYEVGLPNILDKYIYQLSGGEQQRIALAKCILKQSQIILADEPTGNLDSKTELEVISMLKSCVSEYGQTLVMITHDETIAQMADRMIVIEDGKVVRA